MPEPRSTRQRTGVEHSGTLLLSDGLDAFAARAMAIRAAEATIDLQYYIWKNGLTGDLLLDEIADAAERGVRVRLLLDDNGISKLDSRLRVLADHANIEVRLFKPFRWRWFKPLDFVFDFARTNRRMHSKSFTVDDRITIVGGRNIGDEYFGATERGVFADIDALCVGPVVAEVAREFARFWASDGTQDIVDLVPEVAARHRKELAKRKRARLSDRRAATYAEAVEASPLMHDLKNGTASLTWAPVTLFSDPPEKALMRKRARTSLTDELTELIGKPVRQLLIISAYFVPTECGADALAEMARRGVDLRVLTNSYASTDVGVVHAGYRRYRRQLVQAGVRLFEMPAPDDARKSSRKFVRTGSRKGAGPPGSTLHAKAFAVDGERLFVGSLNLDPRSFWLNTELGIVIESPELAREMTTTFDELIAPNSYNVVMDDGAIGWVDVRDDDPAVERVEPFTTPWSRAAVWALGRLPIEWLL